MKAIRLAALLIVSAPLHAQSLSVEQYVAAEVADANNKLATLGQPDPSVHTFPATADGKTIAYRFALPNANGANHAQRQAAMQRISASMTPGACGVLLGTGYYDRGLQMRYSYETGEGVRLGSFTVNKRQCDAFARDNAATCLIDNLRSVQNDAAARAAARVCTANYPGGLESVPQGIARPLGDYGSGDECTMKNGSDTPSEVAAIHIRRACNKLHNGPRDLFEEFGIQP